MTERNVSVFDFDFAILLGLTCSSSSTDINKPPEQRVMAEMKGMLVGNHVFWFCMQVLHEFHITYLIYR